MLEFQEIFSEMPLPLRQSDLCFKYHDFPSSSTEYYYSFHVTCLPLLMPNEHNSLVVP
jgi:hypothetical protein